jgi:hypothetical protein
MLTFGRSVLRKQYVLMEVLMEAKAAKQRVKNVATVKLTEEQRAAIEKATGVALKEITVFEHTGDSARQLNNLLVKGNSVVLCW